MRVEPNRLFPDEQRQALRRRDGALACAALLLHAALLIAIPGFALPQMTTAPLLIELVQPQTEASPAAQSELQSSSTAPGGGVELPGASKVNQPLNRQT